MNNVKIILNQLAFYKKAYKIECRYQFWQEYVHPEWIQNEAIMRQKVEYIHHNPVKRGYVDQVRTLALFECRKLCRVRRIVEDTVPMVS